MPRYGNPTTYTDMDPPSYSDGVDTVYPSNTDQQASPENWYSLRDIDDEKAVMFRVRGAASILAKFPQPTMPQGVEYILTGFPANYKLFKHTKKQSDGNWRTDFYIYGHPNGSRFRSFPEFEPHLLHLAALSIPDIADTEVGKEYLTCKCKYCNTISRGGGSGSASVSKSTKKASSKAVDPKLKVKANIQAYLDAEHNERVAESQVEGWVFRKGEIVWVWSADEDITNFDHATASGMTENWAAGIVIENPPEAPSLLVMPPNEPRKFIANDGKPLEYKVQLWSEGGNAGQILDRIYQHALRPWLSRSSVKLPKEHFTVAFARNLAGTASAFEVIEEEYENGNDKYPARTYYGGLFLGPEKIFLGDPVRILRKPKPVPKEGVVAEDSEDGDNEDVLVVEKIFNDASKSTLPPDADSGRRRTHNVISIRGSVYTHYPDEMSRDFELSPQEFAQLPYRMRQPDMYGELKPWYARSASTERGICSIKFINGRWYEPAALKAWGIPALLPKPSLKKRYESRGDALGWDHLNGIQLIGPEDRIRRPAAELANPPSSTPTKGSSNVNVYGDKMDIDGDNGPVMTSPTSNFISVNGPESNSAIKMSMTLAALRDNMADDDNEIEEEDEEQVVTEKTLGQVFSSPKKRLYMRQK